MSTRTYMTGQSTVRKHLAELPPNMRNLAARKALSKAGGIFKRGAQALAPVDTKLLKQSLAVKTKVPRDEAKPAYTMVGAQRGRRAAIERRPQARRQKLSALRKSANRKVSAKTLKLLPGGAFKYRTPTRYLHLAEKHHGFMSRAYNAHQSEAVAAIESKLAEIVKDYNASVKAPKDNGDG